VPAPYAVLKRLTERWAFFVFGIARLHITPASSRLTLKRFLDANALGEVQRSSVACAGLTASKPVTVGTAQSLRSMRSIQERARLQRAHGSPSDPKEDTIHCPTASLKHAQVALWADDLCPGLCIRYSHQTLTAGKEPNLPVPSPTPINFQISISDARTYALAHAICTSHPR
jgi:hypothetical protein